ncbi:MAG: ferric reductase [Anaerolineae bacterium]|nr:ferric reductase [Anaerolineae bacterium]
MTKQSKKGKLWYLAVIGAAVLALVIVLEAIQPNNTPLDWVIRSAALLGYFCVFGAIVSSAYIRQMMQFFGRPFLRVHHIISIAGLVLITIHPLGVAWNALGLKVFIPDVSSWYAFLAYGGRPAWYLIGVASLVAALRKPIGKNWKLLHYLNYLAFWLATVHGILIGANVQNVVMRIVFVVLALIVLGVMVQKRFLSSRPKSK